MAYLSGYQHDIFVSYAHIDNVPLGNEKGWVTMLVDHLKIVLDKGLGNGDTHFWFDPDLKGNEPFSQKIESGLQGSATLLVIASPSYLRSPWCARERNAFLKTVRERSAAGSRIFRVDVDKLDRKEFPPEFGELLGYTFWTTDKNGNPRTLGQPIVDAQVEPEYFTALTKLKIELCGELERLRALPPGQTTLPRSGTSIFLAEVTDDLEEQREELDSYAKQAGLSVLPATWYPRDDLGEYQRRMQADLEQSKLFVQLLGELPGKKPSGWPSRLPIVQYQQAKEKGCHILQWRARETDLEKLKTTAPEHHSLVVGPEVRACGIEEFKRAVVEEATRAPKAPPKPVRSPSNILVFVNSDSPDRQLAEEVCQILFDEGIGFSKPLVDEKTKPAEVREDLEMNLATCDGLIVVYGSTPVTWVRRQLAQGRKILSQREQPLAVLGIFEGPPADKQEVNFLLPNMRSLDCRGGVRREVVLDFVSALGV